MKYSPKSISLMILAIVIIIASIKPLHYPSYILHQIGTFIMLGALCYLNNKIRISNLAFIGYIAFLIIHVFAAHYLYSYVPYNEWLIKVFHFDLNALFGFKRNMFDRVVHFGYGFLLYPLIFEVLKIWLKPLNQAIKIHVIAIGFVMASSMVYELIEWRIAIGLSPETAENYNGQQGDIWDAHTDMFLASVGAMAGFWLIRIKERFKT